jgi:putative peptidoglycan lipid II flippase
VHNARRYSAVFSAPIFLYTKNLMGLFRSAATVGFLTLVSRVIGFLREIIFAAFLGAGPLADAFFISLRLPSLFRSLFDEGAFSTAFVPGFAGTVAERGKQAMRLDAEDALGVLLSIPWAFVVLGEFLMPAIIHVLAPGFATDPGKFALAVELTRITFPYLLLIVLAALLGSLLNAVDRFAVAAATPILPNLFIIATLVAMGAFGSDDGRFLAWAITIGGMGQFLWLMLACARAGLALRLPRPRLTPGVRRTLSAMAPALLGSGVTQLNLLVSTALASLLPTGSVSYLYYADRLNQLPLGVVGIAVGTAILPSLSRQIRLGDLAAARITQNRGIELAVLLSVPASIGLGLLARPIFSVLFQHGAFGSVATAATAAALSAYAAGLPGFVLVRVLVPTFFAHGDMATPAKVAILVMGINFVLSVALMHVLGHVGVALATAAAGWVNALLLLRLSMRRGFFRIDERMRRNLPRIAVAALTMGAVLQVLQNTLASAFAGTTVVRLGALVGLICIGIVVFVGLTLLLGMADLRDLRRLLARQSA